MIENKEKAIENAHQALFPEGRIWIVTPLDIPYELHLTATSLINHPTWQPFFENYSLPVRYLSIKDTYALLLKNHLFSIYMRSRKKEILFPSRELFQKALLASAPYLDALPPSLKDSFLVDLVDQYIQFRPADRFGRISCSLEILEIIAMKKSAFHP